MASCTHCTTEQLKDVWNLIHSAGFEKELRNQSVQCKMCSERGDVWLCLNGRCENVGCGRSVKQHAIEHYNGRGSGHEVCISIASGMVWCFACNEEILDNHLVQIREHVQTLKMESACDYVSYVPPPGCGLRGLVNLGNTCYLNAVLQCLANVPAFSEFFITCDGVIDAHPSRTSHHPLIANYTATVVEMWNGQTTPVEPRGVVADMKRINPVFSGYGQQDSQEFLRSLLDALHDNLKIQYTPSPEHVPGSTEEGTSAAYYRSIVSDAFRGLLRSNVTCSNCQLDSVTKEYFYDLSLELPSKKQREKLASKLDGTEKKKKGWFSGLFGKSRELTLEECLYAYCDTDVLQGNDRYYCENCKGKFDSVKTLHVQTAPEVLCVHIKRFQFDRSGSKLPTSVSFKLEGFDLSPFLDEGGGPVLYDLVAMVNHSGGLHGGHYVAFCKNRANENWHKFDDRSVTKVQESTVRSAEAYVLFYVKRPKRELSALPATPLGTEKVFVSKEWAHRYRWFDAPGPVTTDGLTCEHNALRSRGPTVSPESVVAALPLEQYEALCEVYGGGEPLLSLEPCAKCMAERQALEDRRVNEKRTITQLDSKSVDAGEAWYLLSSSWLSTWHAFVTSKGPVPGPIDNISLLDEHGNPIKGLRKTAHYRGVVAKVWQHFLDIYGGGPVLARASIDIYSPAVEG